MIGMNNMRENTIAKRNAKIHPELTEQDENRQVIDDWASNTVRAKILEPVDPLLPDEQSYKPFLER